jgi:TP901 family phage tail tape measure protein
LAVLLASSEFLAIVRLAVKGAQSARKDIETYRESIMDTGKAAGLTKKQLEDLDKAISKGSTAQREATKASRDASRAKKEQADSTNNLQKNTDRLGGTSLPRLRYALYDVSQTAALLGAAMAAIGFGVLKTAVSFERSFADVVRTTGVTGVEVEKLRGAFERLNTELPVSFKELTAVGKLAGQLGIPTADIENFTRLVVQFSETTGVGVEDAATAFGRLSALLGLTGDQFDNLGSSILKAGTSFVATESDIIAISTQLAGIGRQAGLTADQVIGLSTALASVGIAPELARGVITRTFGRIGQAVAAGGSRLSDFAKIAGMSSQEFATAWQEDASGAFLAFTRGIQARGGQAEAALAALGITSVRDVPALLRLAQTSESILAPALGVAAQGFEEGTELADQYGIIAGTTEQQLLRLKQTVEQLFNEMAKGVLVFSPAIESLSSIVRVMSELAKNPVVGFFSSAILAATALGGVFLIVIGGAIRFAASLLAVRTSLKELNAIGNGKRVTLLGLVKAAYAAATGNQKLSASQLKVAQSTKAVNLSLKEKNALLFANGQRTSQIAMAQMNLAGTTGHATSALKGQAGALGMVTTALKAIPWFLAIDAVFKLINGFQRLKESSEEASSQLNDYVNGASNFTNSTEAAVNQINILSEGLENSAGWVTKTIFAVNSLFGLTPEWFVLRELASGIGMAERFAESLKKLSEEGNTIQALDIASAMVRQLEEAGLSTDKFIESLRELNPQIAAALEGSYGAALAIQAMDDAHSDAAFAALDQAEQIAILRDEMMAIVDDAYALINAEFAMEDALNKLGEAFARNGSDVEANGKAIQTVIALIIDQAQGDIPTAVANIQALYDTLISEGVAYAGQLQTIQQIISNLLATLGADSAKLPGALTAMGGTGYTIPAPTIDLTPLKNSWTTVTEEVNKTASGTKRVASNTKEAASAAREQTKAVRETRQEVVTLVDYARDLSQVFSRAFDLRFKSQSQLDSIADTWDNIAKRVKDAENRVKELQREQTKLAADKSIKQYFLSVAQAYGDTLRSEVLSSEISDIDAQLAQNASDTAEAKSDASKQLTGNSKAARQNRAALSGLVGQYQDYIASLAESGLSQEQLRIETDKARREFVKQARDMGFSSTDIKKYAGAFDDVNTAIRKVPRKVTIEADVNPAITAIKEFNAGLTTAITNAKSLADSMRAIPGPPSGGGGGGGGGGRKLTASDRKKLEDDLARQRGILAGHNSDKKLYQLAGKLGEWTRIRNDLIADIKRIEDILKRGHFASGGFTGRGGKYEPAGVVHKGEFVVPKQYVNQATGMPDMTFLAAMQNGMRSYAQGGPVGVSVNMPDAVMVELSPYDRKLLEQAGNVQLRLDGKVVAKATNVGNVVSAQRGSN